MTGKPNNRATMPDSNVNAISQEETLGTNQLIVFGLSHNGGHHIRDLLNDMQTIDLSFVPLCVSIQLGYVLDSSQDTIEESPKDETKTKRRSVILLVSWTDGGLYTFAATENETGDGYTSMKQADGGSFRTLGSFPEIEGMSGIIRSPIFSIDIKYHLDYSNLFDCLSLAPSTFSCSTFRPSPKRLTSLGCEDGRVFLIKHDLRSGQSTHSHSFLDGPISTVQLFTPKTQSPLLPTLLPSPLFCFYEWSDTFPTDQVLALEGKSLVELREAEIRVQESEHFDQSPTSDYPATSDQIESFKRLEMSLLKANNLDEHPAFKRLLEGLMI